VASIHKLDQIATSLEQINLSLKRAPVQVDAVVDQLDQTITNINRLGQSGETSLRKVQDNLIQATKAITDHLSKG